MVSDAFCAMCGAPSGNSRLCPEHKACSPPEQLRHHLVTARAGGVSFEKAWASAIKKLTWPHDTTHRQDWKTVLEEEKAEWEASYDRRANRRRRRAYEDALALSVLIDAA